MSEVTPPPSRLTAHPIPVLPKGPQSVPVPGRTHGAFSPAGPRADGRPSEAKDPEPHGRAALPPAPRPAAGTGDLPGSAQPARERREISPSYRRTRCCGKKVGLLGVSWAGFGGEGAGRAAKEQAGMEKGMGNRIREMGQHGSVLGRDGAKSATPQTAKIQVKTP